MEPLRIDLDEFQNMTIRLKIFYTLVGLAIIGLSIYNIYNKVMDQRVWYSLIFPVIFAIIGLNIILYCHGILFRLSRRYVLVNETFVDYKLYFFNPSRHLNWKDIKKVDIRTLRVFFVMKNGAQHKMRLGEILYQDLRSLKKYLAELAEDKGIEWKDTTDESKNPGKNLSEVLL
jgi:hypothetical protein